MKILLKGARILDENFRFTDGALIIEDGVIAAVLGGDDDPGELISEGDGQIDLGGDYVIPGLIDIHTHGNSGSDFSVGDRAALDDMALYLARSGITSFVPTTSTLPMDQLMPACERLGDLCRSPVPGSAYAHGIYLEGPFLSRQKRGAAREDYLQPPSPLDVVHLDDASGGNVLIVAIAPEEDRGFEFIKALQDDYELAIAHTAAGYDVIMGAIAAGASSATHLFNAMSPLGHREPGAVGAVLDSDIFAELICDGVHIHPAVVRVAFRLLMPDRLIMVSDSMAAAGMDDGEYNLCANLVTVKNRRATLADGTIAGSAYNLMDGLKSAVSMGIPLELAVRAASINPARLLGVDDVTGSIAVGKSADLVVLGRDSLEVAQVFVRGDSAPRPIKPL